MKNGEKNRVFIKICNMERWFCMGYGEKIIPKKIGKFIFPGSPNRRKKVPTKGIFSLISIFIEVNMKCCACGSTGREFIFRG
jgi:hypothetical protein